MPFLEINQTARDAIERITQSTIYTTTTVTGGRNSRLYRVECTNKITYAVKHYPSELPNLSSRLRRETTALKFFSDAGICCVPLEIGKDWNQNLLVLNWLEGDQISHPTSSDLDAAIDFISDISASVGKSSDHIECAKEAFRSVADLTLNLDQRISRMRAAAEFHPDLAEFLNRYLLPAYEFHVERVQKKYSEKGIPLDAESGEVTLSPSDFGFHNALRLRSGTVCFLDFEYFGWDDPVKFMIDSTIHPRNLMTEEQKSHYSNELFKIYGAEELFKFRYKTTKPLFYLRWALIILNEFLSENWEIKRRVISTDRNKVLSTQLKFASQYLTRLDSLPRD